jgi:hypothetical protein
MSWLSSFLHPERGYQKGQEQLDKYYQQGQGYLQPYNQFGQNAYGNINEAMQALLNPEALQSKWAQGYEESPAAKQLEGMAQEHGLNAARSMGLMGSTPALQAIQAGTSQIGANDRQQYLDNLMQKYLAGIGIGQDIFGKGASAAGQMSNNANQMGQNSAQMKFGEQNAPGNMFSKLLEGAASFATPIGQGWGMNKLGLNNSPWTTGGA